MDLYVDRNVSAKVGRVDNERVESDVGSEGVNGECKGV